MINMAEQIFGIYKYMINFHYHSTFPTLGGKMVQKPHNVLVLWLHAILLVAHAYVFQIPLRIM